MTDQSVEESIFLAAIEKSSKQERDTYVQAACLGEPDMLQRVQELLDAHDKSRGPFDAPPTGLEAPTLPPSPITEGPGAEIGPYKLLQQIGEGGMGVVYLAEQQEPVRRKVALKIIKPGMDTELVIARFEAERQALAMMEHQNIARVFDAGTTATGRPYFVMELVRGVPITEYCDKNRLAPPERLELFANCCRAIQHAHQKGIIHRDIKPSNVLVCLYDGKPVPKVIDFGVAKAIEQRLTERTLFTQHGQVIGTLEYMSPEQAEMSQLDIDTRSDIYSLGVLLYELLTGSTPITKQQLQEAAFVEILRAICEDEPVKPSTRLSESRDTLPTVSAQRKTEPNKLGALIRGELDWIVMKALEKDRTRRYDSAHDFARDIQRYLEDEPVEACPPTAGYRLRKFARKYRAAISTAAMLASILIIATAVSTWQAYQAHMAKRVLLAMDRERTVLLQQTREETARAKQAEENAKDTLVRSLFEQARAVRLAAQDGHRWRSRELLRRAELLRGRGQSLSVDSEKGATFEPRQGLARDHTQLPTRAELRSEAVASLVVPDGHVEREWGGVYQVADPLGQFGGVIHFEVGPNNIPSTTMQIVEFATGDEVGKWKLEGAAGTPGTGAFALGPKAKLIATSQRGEIRVTEARSERLVASLSWPKQEAASDDGRPDRALAKGLGSVTWMEFSPDGRHLAAFRVGASLGEVVLWSLADDQPRTGSNPDQSANPPTVGRRMAMTRELMLATPNFSSDSDRLAYPLSENKVAVWNVNRNEMELEIDAPQSKRPFGPVAFAPDGRSLAFVCGGNEEALIVVWDLVGNTKGHEIATGYPTWTSPPRISPDNRYLATGTMQGEVFIFRLDEQAEACRLDHGGMARNVAWLGDGRRMLTVGAMALKKWQVALERPVRTLRFGTPDKFSDIKFAFGPDGRWMAAAGKRQLHIFRWPDAVLHHTFQIPIQNIIQVQFTADGGQLVVIGVDGAVGYDVESHQQIFHEQGRALLSAGLTGDGRTLVLEGKGSDILLSELGSNEPIWEAARDIQRGVSRLAAMSPDGRLLATWSLSFQRGVQPTPLEIRALPGSQKVRDISNSGGPIVGARFSADGRWLVTLQARNPFANPSGAAATLKVCVWDTESGTKKLEVTGSEIRSHAISQDGVLLAVQFRGGHVELWNTESSEELFTWTSPEQDASLVQPGYIEFTTDGTQLGAVANADGGIQVLNIDRVRQNLDEIGLAW